MISFITNIKSQTSITLLIILRNPILLTKRALGVCKGKAWWKFLVRNFLLQWWKVVLLLSIHLCSTSSFLSSSSSSSSYLSSYPPPSKQLNFPFIQLLPPTKTLKVSDRFEWDFAKPIPTHKPVCFVMFRLCVGFINWFWKKNLGCSRLTVETCSWFSLYWLRGELTRDDFPNPPLKYWTVKL